MGINVIVKDRTAAVLLQILQSGNEQAQSILAFFTAYCDCNVVEWIISRVEVNDEFVIGKIQELITFNDSERVIRGELLPVNGQLVNQYCNGDDLIGIYADGLGGETLKTIQFQSASCYAEQLVHFYYPLPTQKEVIDQDSPNVVFSNSPYYPSYDWWRQDSQLFYVQVFHNSPKVARIQVKVDDLPDGKYDELVVTIGSSLGIDYEKNGFSEVVPYNTVNNDWTHGQLTAVFDPVTQIMKIEKSYTAFDRGSSSVVDIILSKRGNIVGWLTLSFSSGPYDSSLFVGNPWDLLTIDKGSMW